VNIGDSQLLHSAELDRKVESEKTDEGFEPHMYNRLAGDAMIGHGHLVHHVPICGALGGTLRPWHHRGGDPMAIFRKSKARHKSQISKCAPTASRRSAGANQRREYRRRRRGVRQVR
jgi:hypothetical protein